MADEESIQETQEWSLIYLATCAYCGGALSQPEALEQPYCLACGRGQRDGRMREAPPALARIDPPSGISPFGEQLESPAHLGTRPPDDWEPNARAEFEAGASLRSGIAPFVGIGAGFLVLILILALAVVLGLA
jgi:hypothetical protein